MNAANVAEHDVGAAVWPDTSQLPYGYLLAGEGPPDAHGMVADIVLDGAGVYLAASTPNLRLRVRLASANVPGLAVVPMGVSLTRGPIEGRLWHQLVERARAAMPSEVLLAVVARDPSDGELLVGAEGPYTLVEPQLDAYGTGDWRPQEQSSCRVRATPVHDAVVEIHSHHTMRAYFSATDDRDETGRRIYGVLGRLDSPHPEIALRVATGCNPHAVGPVPFSQVFAADPGEFCDVQFATDVSEEWRTVDRTESPLHRPSPFRIRWSVVGPLLEMAEDVAAIRQLLESNWPHAEAESEPGLRR
jgi:hypothetical protein